MGRCISMHEGGLTPKRRLVFLNLYVNIRIQAEKIVNFFFFFFSITFQCYFAPEEFPRMFHLNCPSYQFDKFLGNPDF